MKRILIFAEAVTLAHVGRPITLSRLLRELGHQVCIAASPVANRWLTREEDARLPIESISSNQFLAALANGTPVYAFSTIKRYVEDDLQAIAAWQPDIVLGDFRLSLYISSRLAGKPYGALTNAYWSRCYWEGVELPTVKPLRWLGTTVASAIFRAVYPAAFALHAIPFWKACRYFGVAPPRVDIRDAYTISDDTAFADVASFYGATDGDSAKSRFIGPLDWSSGEQLPEITRKGPPIVFVSLGSSGPSSLLPRVVAALGAMPIRTIIATAGEVVGHTLPKNCIYASSYVPYADACAIASVVVCNGGSPATYQALARGTPLLGLPSNLDQFLNVRVVNKLEASRTLRADSASDSEIASAVSDLLRMPAFSAAARVAAIAIARCNSLSRVQAWIRALIDFAKPSGKISSL